MFHLFLSLKLRFVYPTNVNYHKRMKIEIKSAIYN